MCKWHTEGLEVSQCQKGPDGGGGERSRVGRTVDGVRKVDLYRKMSEHHGADTRQQCDVGETCGQIILLGSGAVHAVVQNSKGLVFIAQTKLTNLEAGGRQRTHELNSSGESSRLIR